MKDGVKRKLILPDPDILETLSYERYVEAWDRHFEGESDKDMVPLAEYRITKRDDVPNVDKRLTLYEYIFVAPSCANCTHADPEYADDDVWDVCGEWRGDRKIFCRRQAIAYRKVA